MSAVSIPELDMLLVTRERSVHVYGADTERVARAFAAEAIARKLGDSPVALRRQTDEGATYFDFIALPGGFAQRPLAVTCWLCRAPRGQACTTRTGSTSQIHAQRLRAFAHAFSGRTMRMMLTQDDPRFGLAAGEILICVSYPLDQKVTVLRRESDGFDPECNQYSADVAFIDFEDTTGI